jgi:hypothetical protein
VPVPEVLPFRERALVEARVLSPKESFVLFVVFVVKIGS